jgi:histidine ammonia-lyase
VSMGWGAARKLRRSIENLERIVAIELIAGARGLDLRAPLAPARGTDAARAALREIVPGFGPDRHVAPELSAVERAVRDGSLLAAVEAGAGALA